MMRIPMHRLFALALLIALAVSLAALPSPARARQDTCGTAPQPRLTIGQQGRVTVTDGTGSNMRGTPGTTAIVLSMLADGEVFTVIDGPQCTESFWWWQVRRSDGGEGWIAEGLASEYWVEPWPAAQGAPVSMGEKAGLTGVLIAYYSGVEDQMLPSLINADGSGAHTLAPVQGYDSRLAWSPDGQWLAFTDGNDLYIASVDGSVFNNLTNTSTISEYWPSWSPDSTRVAYTSQAGENMDVHMIAINGGQPLNLTNDPAIDGWPAWSPDGTRIAFASDRSGNLDIYSMSAADGSDVQQITHGENNETQPAYSPDGLSVALLEVTDTFSNLLVIQPPYSATVMTTEANVTDFAWSPDGMHVAYVAETPLKSGQYELFTTRWDMLEPLQITNFGKQIAGLSWSPDGEYLAFSSNSAGAFDLYTIHQGGYGLARLTENTTLDTFPVFMPSTAPIVQTASAATAATQVPASAANPAEQDLLLIYDPAVPVFTLKNVSGAVLNLQPLTFQGAGRTVNADIWTTYLPATSPVTNFVAGGCAMIWPWGIADQPAPTECGAARQGWVTDATATFWNAGSFTVSYNGALVATCDSNAKTCGVNLP